MFFIIYTKTIHNTSNHARINTNLESLPYSYIDALKVHGIKFLTISPSTVKPVEKIHTTLTLLGKLHSLTFTTKNLLRLLMYIQFTQLQSAVFQIHRGIFRLLISCLEAEILPFKDIYPQLTLYTQNAVYITPITCGLQIYSAF